MKIFNKNNFFDDTSGELIYHYTRRETAIENIFPKNQLKFSPPLRINDPLEFEFFHFEIDQQITNAILNVQYEINETIKEKYKICCFSIDEKNNGIYSKCFLRPRMWSQYADSHKRVCLVFKRNLFHDNLIANTKAIDLPIGSSVIVDQGKIVYDNGLKDLHDILSIRLQGNSKNFAENFIKKYIDRLLFTKLEDYKSES